MFKKRKSLFSFGLFLCVFFTISLFLSIRIIANEQDTKQKSTGLTISPAIIEEEISIGTSKEFEMLIENNNDFPVAVTIDSKDYDQDQLGNPLFLNLAEGEGIRNHLKITPNDLLLDSGEKQAINIKLEIPDYLETKSYMVAVIFKTIVSEAVVDDFSVPIFPFLSGIIAISVVDQENSPDPSLVRISNVKIDSDFKNNMLKEQIFIENIDSFYHKNDIKVEYKNILGRVVKKDSFDNISVLPEREKIFEVGSGTDLAPGWYQAEYYLNDDAKVSYKTSFLNFTKLSIFILIISLVVAIILLIYVLIIYTKKSNYLTTVKEKD